MANALDRVKAAEAKYAAMAGTAEKLEATGGARHGVPGPGSSPPRSRARLPRRGARSQAGGNSRAASNAGSRSLIERVTIFAPGEMEAGSAGKQPCRGIARRAHRDDDSRYLLNTGVIR